MCKFAGVFEWVFCSPIILILNVIILRVIFLTLASDGTSLVVSDSYCTNKQKQLLKETATKQRKKYSVKVFVTFKEWTNELI